jgi:hypothetical protein
MHYHPSPETRVAAVVAIQGSELATSLSGPEANEVVYPMYIYNVLNHTNFVPPTGNLAAFDAT